MVLKTKAWTRGICKPIPPSSHRSRTIARAILRCLGRIDLNIPDQLPRKLLILRLKDKIQRKPTQERIVKRGRRKNLRIMERSSKMDNRKLPVDCLFVSSASRMERNAEMYLKDKGMGLHVVHACKLRQDAAEGFLVSGND